MAKLFLKRHQRALIPTFRQYQLDELDAGSMQPSAIGDQNDALLTGTLNQADSTVSVMADDFENDEHLTNEQLELLREIAEQFSPEDNTADLCILYECTGFKANTESARFWDNYKDLVEPGEEDKLVNEKKYEDED